MKWFSLGRPSSPPHPPFILRYPTLESQEDTTLESNGVVGWAKALFAQDKEPPDPAAEKLKKAVLSATGAERNFLKRLLSDYARIKDSPGYGLGEDLLFYCTIYSNSNGCALRSCYEPLILEENATFLDLVSALSEALKSKIPGGLRLLAVSSERAATQHKGFFTSRHKMVATLLGRLRSLPLVPNNVIWFLVEESMEICLPRLNSPIEPSIKDERRRLLHPPSLDRKLEIVAEADASLLNLETSTVTAGDLDPSKLKNNHIILKWQSKAPSFTTDLDIYIWEQHKSLPMVRCADIHLIFDRDILEDTLLITFSHSSSLRKLRNVRARTLVYQPDPPPGVQAWSPKSEIAFSVCDIFQVMILELTNFVQGCSVQLERMAIAIRQNPTADKSRYLVHFEDCRSSAHDGTLHGIQVLHCLARWLDLQQRSQQLWNAGLPFQCRFESIQRDLEYFDAQLSVLSLEVKDLQAKLRDHLELTHNRRNFLLTLLAAIFLPLSFATSLFGMNMQPKVFEPTTGNKSNIGTAGFTNFTASLIDNLPIDTQNTTRAITAAIDSSGTVTFTWQTFIITCVLLVLTLPVILTFGGIFRLLYRTTSYYSTYWRIFALIPSAMFILLTVVPVPFAEGVVYTNFRYSTILEWYFSIDLSSADEIALEALVITSFSCSGLMILFEFWKTYQAWKTKRRLVFWSALSVITSVCLIITVVLSLQSTLLQSVLLSSEGNYPFLDDPGVPSLVPWMAFPWLCFAGNWFWSWWMRRRRIRLEA